MCPRCKSEEIRRSRSRNFFLDIPMLLAGMQAFRCRECNKRFYAKRDLAAKLRARRAWLRSVEHEHVANTSQIY